MWIALFSFRDHSIAIVLTLACEYLVGKDILRNLDSEYLRSVRHKHRILFHWISSFLGVLYQFMVTNIFIFLEAHILIIHWVVYSLSAPQVVYSLVGEDLFIFLDLASKLLWTENCNT